MGPSPITVGLALGLVVGAVGVGVVAATVDYEQERAPMYVIADPGAPSTASIDRLAGALGVHASVQEDVGGWVVREDDRLLRVSRTTGLPWFLAKLGGPCQLVPGAPERDEPLPTVQPSGPTDCPETRADGAAAPPARPGNLPTAEEAVARATEAMRYAGLGASEVNVFDTGIGWRVDGGALGEGQSSRAFGWSVTVGVGSEIQAANGYLEGQVPR